MGLLCFKEYFTSELVYSCPFLYAFANTGFSGSVKLWHVYTADEKMTTLCLSLQG